MLDVRHTQAINGEINLKLVFEFIDQDLATYLEGCPAPGLGPDRIRVSPVTAFKNDSQYRKFDF